MLSALTLLVTAFGSTVESLEKDACLSRHDCSDRECVMLTTEEENVIRTFIYEGKRASAVIRYGKLAGYTVLLVPARIEKIYQKKKVQTLKLCATIVQGARPTDALLAAAYAECLTNSPVAGYLTSQLPIEQFDSVVSGKGLSLRTHLARLLAKRIADVAGSHRQKGSGKNLRGDSLFPKANSE